MSQTGIEFNGWFFLANNACLELGVLVVLDEVRRLRQQSSDENATLRRLEEAWCEGLRTEVGHGGIELHLDEVVRDAADRHVVIGAIKDGLGRLRSQRTASADWLNAQWRLITDQPTSVYYDGSCNLLLAVEPLEEIIRLLEWAARRGPPAPGQRDAEEGFFPDPIRDDPRFQKKS